MSECTHTPKCGICRICGKQLEDPCDEVDAGGKNFLVTYDNGARNIILGCSTVEKAVKISMINISRSAGLCFNHMNKARSVREISQNSSEKKTIEDLSKTELLSLIYSELPQTLVGDHPVECTACGTESDRLVKGLFGFKPIERDVPVYWYVCDRCNG